MSVGGVMKIGIFGATGYVGQQLVTLLLNHPNIEIKFLSSKRHNGQPYDSINPKFKHRCSITCCDIEEALLQLDEVELVFMALPHGHSSGLMPKLKHVKVIDLGGDHRLKSYEIIKKWYGITHDIACLDDFIYGLPEVNKSAIESANYIANPGCYPTASIIGLLPVMHENFIDTGSIIIDAKSGVSGAGKKVNEQLIFCEVNESLKAYGISNHRHTPEIEQMFSQVAEKKIVLNFTPHLVPMLRGILVTSYVKLKQKVSQQVIQAMYQKYYDAHPFVRVVDYLPETKYVTQTNFCDVYIKVDERTNCLIVVTAIDNLIKGSAGSAIQNMNLMMGWEETAGL